jgi:cell division protease FtsH
VREFGMSPRLGPVGFSEEGPQYLGPQQLTTRTYAEETQRVIDEEVSRLLKEADDRAGALLKSRRGALEAVVARLLERETIDGEEVEEELGKERVDDIEVLSDPEPKVSELRDPT